MALLMEGEAMSLRGRIKGEKGRNFLSVVYLLLGIDCGKLRGKTT